MELSSVLEFGGERYMFDINKILEFVSEENGTKPVEKEIIDSYDVDDNGDLSVSQKMIREISENINQQYNSTKYDLIRLFIETTNSMDSMTVEELTIGDKIVLNTLLENKLLKQVK